MTLGLLKDTFVLDLNDVLNSSDVVYRDISFKIGFSEFMFDILN